MANPYTNALPIFSSTTSATIQPQYTQWGQQQQQQPPSQFMNPTGHSPYNKDAPNSSISPSSAAPVSSSTGLPIPYMYANPNNYSSSSVMSSMNPYAPGVSSSITANAGTVPGTPQPLGNIQNSSFISSSGSLPMPAYQSSASTHDTSNFAMPNPYSSIPQPYSSPLPTMHPSFMSVPQNILQQLNNSISVTTEHHLQKEIERQAAELNEYKEKIKRLEEAKDILARQLKEEKETANGLQMQMNLIGEVYQANVEEIHNALKLKYKQKLEPLQSLLKENAELIVQANRWEQEFNSLKAVVSGSSGNYASGSAYGAGSSHASSGGSIGGSIGGSSGGGSEFGGGGGNSRKPVAFAFDIDKEVCPTCQNSFPAEDFLGHVQFCVNIEEDSKSRFTAPYIERPAPYVERPAPKREEWHAVPNVPKKEEVIISYKAPTDTASKQLNVPKGCTIQEVMQLIKARENKEVNAFVQGAKAFKAPDKLPDDLTIPFVVRYKSTS